MGISDVRNSFNEIARPFFTATQAFQSYRREQDGEVQVLLFKGAAQDGTPFNCESEKLRLGTDLIAAAQQTARDLLSKKKATP